MDTELLTKIQEDWPHSHRLILKLFIQQANLAIREMTYLANTRNPIFDTPNRAIASGMNRWVATDYFLERACKMNLLPGIKPIWIPLVKKKVMKGGPHVLELRGKHTSLIAHHTSTPLDPPRNSIFRDFRRILNERCIVNASIQSLFQEENEKNAKAREEMLAAASLVNLTIVHGGKAAPFAHMRIYYKRKKPKVYFSLFDNENIMLMEPLETAGSVEAEQIVEAEIKLKKHLEEIKKQQAQE